jgi:hypothetical protein
VAQSRLAFTAECWGTHAVVCRATENRPGPVAEKQFGVFESWTHAMAFARELNRGLHIDPVEVRQILTSAYLAQQEAFAPIHLRQKFDQIAALDSNTSCKRLLLRGLRAAGSVLLGRHTGERAGAKGPVRSLGDSL